VPTRKQIRLPCYDYATDGAYFVTICTHERRQCLSRIECADLDGGAKMIHLRAGEIVWEYIHNIPKKYPSVTVPNAVVMPDHVHLMILMQNQKRGPGDPAPTAGGEGRATTLGTVIAWFKYQTTKAFNENSEEKTKLWQRGYYEHVIRNDQDYLDCAQYILENPAAGLAALKTETR
jgi:REP element-mobilizing transposase RayT